MVASYFRATPKKAAASGVVKKAAAKMAAKKAAAPKRAAAKSIAPRVSESAASVMLNELRTDVNALHDRVERLRQRFA